MIRKLTILLCLCLFCACAPRNQRPQVNYFDHYVTYSGETLGLIAKWYTGRTENWQVILDHNLSLNVHKMRIGDVVHIPDYLLIRREEMPKQFVAKFYSEHKTEQSREAADPSLMPSASPTEGSATPKTPLPSLHADQGTDDSGSVGNSKANESLGPPEKTLPEAGMNSSGQGQPSAEKHSKSRDDLLNELLSDDSGSGATK